MTKLSFFLFLVLSFFVKNVQAQNCYEGSILSPSPFMGNNGEIFKLSDGTLWEVKYAYEYLYEYYPNVIICPSRGKLIIKGKNIDVTQVSGSSSRSGSSPDFIESQIEGEFSGWSGETIFKLTNGQIWQQSSYSYTYSYKYRPKVIIFSTSRGHELQVDGMNQRIGVKRLKWALISLDIKNM